MRLMIEQTNGNDVLIDGVVDVGYVMPWFGFIELDVLKLINCIMSNIAKNPITNEFKRKRFIVELL